MYPSLPAMEDLEALMAVARAGSISTAARDQGRNQQTMSARIARAEKTLGITVFARSPYGVMLTEQGQAIIDALPDLFSACRTFSDTVARVRADDAPRHLSIAVSNTAAEVYYPTWAAQYQKRYPTVRLSMLQANSRAVRGMVADSAVDLGIVEGGRARHDLFERVVATDELVLVVPHTHPWAARAKDKPDSEQEPITTEQLRDTPLVMREVGSGSRRVIEEALGSVAEPAGEFGSLSSQRAAMMALSAPAIMSRGAVTDQVALERAVIVPTEVRFLRDISAVVRRGVEFNRDAEAFIELAYNICL